MKIRSLLILFAAKDMQVVGSVAVKITCGPGVSGDPQKPAPAQKPLGYLPHKGPPVRVGRKGEDALGRPSRPGRASRKDRK